MATVADLSGNFPASLVNQAIANDPQTMCAPNRSNAGSPAGAITPRFRGEVITDTVNNQIWVAAGTTSSDWVAGVIGAP